MKFVMKKYPKRISIGLGLELCNIEYLTLARN